VEIGFEFFNEHGLIVLVSQRKRNGIICNMI
jgi:hypothetical protein